MTNEELEPFDLNAYLKNPERLRHKCGDKPIKSKWNERVGLLFVEWENGSISSYDQSQFAYIRLAPIPKKEYWLNLYCDSSGYLWTHSYQSLEGAEHGARIHNYCFIKTIKVEI